MLSELRVSKESLREVCGTPKSGGRKVVADIAQLTSDVIVVTDGCIAVGMVMVKGNHQTTCPY